MRLKDKRALSSVIGALFLVVVLSASMGAIFAYQSYQARVTYEDMKAQQAVTERIRENLDVTIVARSQTGDSAMLQIENTGLITAKVTRAVVKDPDTGRSQISPLTYQLTILPNEKQVVVVSIPNGDGDEKIGLITERGKLYGAVPAPRMLTLQSTTGETNPNNPQPPASPTPSNPSPSPSNPSSPSAPVSSSQPPVTPVRPRDNQQQEERVYITMIPLRSNPYIEKIVQYVTERTTKTTTKEITEIIEKNKYIWQLPETTTYTTTIQSTEWMRPFIFTKTEGTSSQTQTFTGGSKPSFNGYIQQQLRNLAIQIHGESFVESQEWFYQNRRWFREGQGGQSLWWINYENYIVSGSPESGTVTLRVPTTLFGTATITFTKQTTSGERVETGSPKPPTEGAQLIDVKRTRVKIPRTVTETVTETTSRAVERQVQTGTVLLDNEGNAWNVFRDPNGQLVLVRGSSERTGEYTVSARDANGNIVWLTPEQAETLMDVITGQAENPGAIGGQLPGTPQFDENGNLEGFAVERRETVTSSSSSESSASTNPLAEQIRSSSVSGSWGSNEAVASYVESQGISSSSELAAAYCASTGASYDQVLATIESVPGAAEALAAFLVANS